MKIYFLRHGETPAVNQGLIQGSSDDSIMNGLSANGQKQVQKSAKELVKKLKGVENVYILQGNQWRTSQSSRVLVGELLQKFEYSDITVSTDVCLKGRNYGPLEGLNEKQIRRKRNVFLKPNLAVSYLLAELGFKNPQGIQPKSEYQEIVARFVENLLNWYENASENSAIIISSTSDVFRAMQQGRASEFCYFGDEEVTKLGMATRSKKAINTGEIVEIEIARPFEVGYDGKIETIAYRRALEKQQQIEK